MRRRLSFSAFHPPVPKEPCPLVLAISARVARRAAPSAGAVSRAVIWWNREMTLSSLNNLCDRQGPQANLIVRILKSRLSPPKASRKYYYKTMICQDITPRPVP
jgi:hypothetical protein